MTNQQPKWLYKLTPEEQDNFLHILGKDSLKSKLYNNSAFDWLMLFAYYSRIAVGLWVINMGCVGYDAGTLPTEFVTASPEAATLFLFVMFGIFIIK